MKTKIFNFSVIIIIFVFLLSSCSTAPATNTLIPPTSTITVTPSPAPTSTSTITPSPTPIPGPWFGIPITTENANQVRQLEIWGKGFPWTWRNKENYWPTWYLNKNLSKLGLGNLWTTLATDIAAQGKTFVVQTPRGVYLYSMENGTPLAEIDNAITYKISDDGVLIATGHNDGSVRMWNASNGKLMQEFIYHLNAQKDLLSKGPNLIPTVGDVAISHNNKTIAAGFADGIVAIWTIDGKTPEVTLDANNRGIKAIAFSPDDQYLMIKSFDASLYFWQIKNENLKWSTRLGHDSFPDFPFSPDGRYFAIYGCADILIFDTSDGSVSNRFKVVKNSCNVKFGLSPDWQKLTVDYLNENERDIRKMPEGTLEETMPLPRDDFPISLFNSGHLWGLAGTNVLPDKSIQAWGSTNNSIYWWNFSENKIVSYPKESEDVFFSSNGKYAAVCQNGNIVIFTPDGIYKSLLIQGHQTCDGIIFSPDDETFAVWTQNRLALVSMSTEKAQDITSHQKPVIGAVFSNDGTLLASADSFYPGQIFIWDTKPIKKHIQILSKGDFYWSGFIPSYFVLEFSSDNKTLASRGYGNPVRLWNTDDGSLLGSVNVSADRIAFLPDQGILATANRVGIISLWQIPDGKKLAELRGHAHLFDRSTGINDIDSVLSFPPDGSDTLSVQYERDKGAVANLSISNLSFLSDGTGLLSVGVDGTIRLWGVDPNINLPVAPPPITYPIFIYPAMNETLEYNNSWKFKIYPVANAEGYLWGFFQNNKLIWENVRDEGKTSGNEYEISKDSIAYGKFRPGTLEISVRALINGEWTDATIIWVTLK